MGQITKLRVHSQGPNRSCLDDFIPACLASESTDCNVDLVLAEQSFSLQKRSCPGSMAEGAAKSTSSLLPISSALRFSNDAARRKTCECPSGRSGFNCPNLDGQPT